MCICFEGKTNKRTQRRTKIPGAVSFLTFSLIPVCSEAKSKAAQDTHTHRKENKRRRWWMKTHRMEESVPRSYFSTHPNVLLWVNDWLSSHLRRKRREWCQIWTRKEKKQQLVHTPGKKKKSGHATTPTIYANDTQTYTHARRGSQIVVNFSLKRSLFVCLASTLLSLSLCVCETLNTERESWAQVSHGFDFKRSERFARTTSCNKKEEVKKFQEK